jgi:hypothetical protein
MKSVCDLSEAQVKKLKLAGKAAARKLFDDAKQPVRQAPWWAGGDEAKTADPPANSLSDEDSEAKEFRTGETKDPAAGDAAPLMVPVSLSDVQGHSIWNRAIQSVLSDQQQQLWKTFVADRDRQTRKMLVGRRVAELQYLLFLRPDQLDSLKQQVERVEADQLVENFDSWQDHVTVVTMANGKSTGLTEEDLKDVLTDRQMAVWRVKEDTGFFGDQTPAKVAGADDAPATGIGFNDRGLEVKSVEEGSFAALIGIKVGDLIDSVNEQPVDTQLQFSAAMEAAGKRASVTVLRDNAEIQLERR